MIIDSKISLDGVEIPNRVVLQPMEGCDCNKDGSPSKLTRDKYINNAQNGAGIIWFEANAVCPEGRTNPGQMMMTEENIDSFKNLVDEVKQTQFDLFGFKPICFIQLTHSGRQSIKPIIAYRNSVYEETRPVSDKNFASDDYLDSLAERFANSASLAKDAGFDGVDVKCCHGYLMQEMLSAFNRPGKYGGSFQNRTRLYKNCLSAVKDEVKGDLIISTRFSVTDKVPYPNGFGTDENNNIKMDEPYKFIELAHDNGIIIINITLGNPYYNPHVNRPYKKGAYEPEESADTGLDRFYKIGLDLKKHFPDILFVNSGLSYYRENLIEKAEEMLTDKAADLVGFGRVTLAYPSFYADYKQGQFSHKKCCMACSRCTELMRAKQVAGCAIFNPYYRQLYKEKVLCKK